MDAETGSIEVRSVLNGEVMSAVEEIRGRPHLVIADISRDDAWITMSETMTTSLCDWR